MNKVNRSLFFLYFLSLSLSLSVFSFRLSICIYLLAFIYLSIYLFIYLSLHTSSAFMDLCHQFIGHIHGDLLSSSSSAECKENFFHPCAYEKLPKQGTNLVLSLFLRRVHSLHVYKKTKENAAKTSRRIWFLVFISLSDYNIFVFHTLLRNPSPSIVI